MSPAGRRHRGRADRRDRGDLDGRAHPGGRDPPRRVHVAGRRLLADRAEDPSLGGVLAVLGFCVVTIFSLLFLLVKESVHRGTVQVTVTNGAAQYVARIPVTDAGAGPARAPAGQLRAGARGAVGIQVHEIWVGPSGRSDAGSAAPTADWEARRCPSPPPKPARPPTAVTPAGDQPADADVLHPRRHPRRRHLLADRPGRRRRRRRDLGVVPGRLPLAFLTAFAYMELVTKYPQAAGGALYCDRAYGIKFLSFLVTFAIMASGVTSATFAASRVGGNYFTGLTGIEDPPMVLIGILAILLVAAINLWGVAESLRVNVVITIIELSRSAVHHRRRRGRPRRRRRHPARHSTSPVRASAWSPASSPVRRRRSTRSSASRTRSTWPRRPTSRPRPSRRR